MRIIIRNLPPKFDSPQVHRLFSQFGDITSVDFPADTARRFCFLGFRDAQSAVKATKTMNKFYIKNYKLAVEPYKEDDYNAKRQKLNTLLDKKDETRRVMGETILVTNLPADTTRKELRAVFKDALSISMKDDGTALVEFDSLESSFKAQGVNVILGKRIRYVRYEAEDDKDERYYNSLFFDFTTVIERIAEEEKVGKGDIVDLKDSNLGARIAILESHLVEQTSTWLEKNGICLNNSGKVNKRVLLIRNYALLKKIANIERAKISVSPNKCLAIVHFDSEGEAERAYRGFMEERRKDKKVFCEFLKTAEDSVPVEIDTCKVLIKNVPFQATENDIKVLVESQVKVAGIRMPVKKDGTRKGFCFIELEDVEKARLVCEYFGKSTHLFGRRLVFMAAEK